MGGLMGTIDLDNIDFEKLRSALEKYYKSEQIYKNPFSVSDVLNVDLVADYKLVVIAIENGFDLEEFKKQVSR